MLKKKKLPPFIIATEAHCMILSQRFLSNIEKVGTGIYESKSIVSELIASNLNKLVLQA